MTDLVLVPTAGRMPDTWTEVIRLLPADLKPRLPNLMADKLESYLDKHELRRVVLVGHGTGALAALELARSQPQRVSHLVLAGLPDSRVGKFLLRRRGIDVQDLQVAMPTLLIDAPYDNDPAGFVAEIRSFLASHTR
ncbi:MAG: hypothetical protein Q4G50_05145 [Corynebacterium sp.]|uniref:alpha/beta fold hydrolase n=1 Tax=Corynebacterium sp. TaxID=1720 RepID=UPI0026DFA40B|nr:alpha/beta hydrolase [Corynebacterium sp.]MDO5669368.1 hypothetical protein [Corynebacterium sp.]